MSGINRAHNREPNMRDIDIVSFWSSFNFFIVLYMNDNYISVCFTKGTMSDENYESISALYFQIGLLSARITKLEEMICQLVNTDDEETDTAELGMAHAEAREGYDDR